MLASLLCCSCDCWQSVQLHVSGIVAMMFTWVVSSNGAHARFYAGSWLQPRSLAVLWLSQYLVAAGAERRLGRPGRRRGVRAQPEKRTWGSCATGQVHASMRITTWLSSTITRPGILLWPPSRRQPCLACIGMKRTAPGQHAGGAGGAHSLGARSLQRLMGRQCPTCKGLHTKPGLLPGCSARQLCHLRPRRCAARWARLRRCA